MINSAKELIQALVDVYGDTFERPKSNEDEVSWMRPIVRAELSPQQITDAVDAWITDKPYQAPTGSDIEIKAKSLVVEKVPNMAQSKPSEESVRKADPRAWAKKIMATHARGESVNDRALVLAQQTLGL